MTFAEHRQAVLVANALNSSLFAEDVTIGSRTVRVKITHESQLQTGKPRPDDRPTRSVAENERIQVLVNRNADAEGSLPVRPQPGETLVRSAERDPDRRPFQFKGDIEFEGDQHAVYYFERARLVAQGGRR